MLEDYITAFLKFFVILDPIGVLPIFLLLSEKLPKRKRLQAGHHTLMVSAGLLIVFIFLGASLLEFLGISMGSFQIAGGIILLVIGLKIVLGLRLGIEQKHAESYDFAVVPMATPLIVGPGAITTVIILVVRYGYLVVFTASFLNLLVFALIFRYADRLYAVLGHQGSQVFSRIMGILLTASAIEFIRQGVLF